MHDYHIHTHYSDGASDFKDYIERAIELGFEEIGFSEHFVLFPPGVEASFSMKIKEIPHYIEELTELRKRYANKIRIKIGVEVDYIPETIDQTLKILDQYPFDYYIVGVHCVDGDFVDTIDFAKKLEKMTETDLERLYIKYFSLVFQALETKRFDILAHPDIVKRLNYRPKTDLTQYYEQLFDIIKRTGTVMEISTAGLFHPVKEIYPDPNMLQLSDKGVPIIVNSDSHFAEHLTRAYSYARQWVNRLKGMGFTKTVSIERHRKKLIELL